MHYVIKRVRVETDALFDLVGHSYQVLSQAHEEATYLKLRNRYLSVYMLATFGDWIQGGYLYALYAEYGYSMHQIAMIFVVRRRHIAQYIVHCIVQYMVHYIVHYIVLYILHYIVSEAQLRSQGEPKGEGLVSLRLTGTLRYLYLSR